MVTGLTPNHTCAEVIARTLHETGVRFAFGHPGGEVLELIDALERTGIRFVLTGHESTAAFMAAAVGRLTGTPGVCVATLGPGACNLVLGVGTAYLDRDPVLAITARTSTERHHRSNKQNLPLIDLFTPITRWSVDLEGADVEDTVKTALSVATGPPRGPVYLSLPSDVAGKPAIGQGTAHPPLTAPADESDLPRILTTLNSAERPVAVVGIAMDAARDAPAVRRFLRDTGLPYATTVQAKGIADERGDGFLGTIAPAAGEDRIIEWLQRSDCVLGIGFDPVEVSRLWHFDAPLQIVADAPVGFGSFAPPAACVGDVSALLDRIAEGYHGRCLWTADDIEYLKARVDAVYHPPSDEGPDGMSPYHLVGALREALPEDTVVSSDVGAHKNVMGQRWRAPEPCTFLMSNGLSSMGYGLGAAMGAAMALPDRPVAAITGDGAFAMMVQELETIRRTGIAPLIVVLYDASLAVIKIAQQARKLPVTGVDFAPVDWVKVAEGFGIAAEAVSTPDETRDAVARWMHRREARVLVARVDERLYTGLKY
ncbi:MAG: thiamine pyrophosphate-binding protein [Gemmatimonadetes bacterium]|nr:thiamine pyrophosphate-binding protein [Gemmatimonadota bacterium]MYH20272.1 thiamine pyrophosphate-binding protein [Gemmatimonadota bacterium]MYK98561.1 thiamine pyrophosphate-binding protein [Gemmatimonadota bacterium]